MKGEEGGLWEGAGGGMKGAAVIKCPNIGQMGAAYCWLGLSWKIRHSQERNVAHSREYLFVNVNLFLNSC